MKNCTENWVVQDDTTRTLTYRNIHHKWNDQVFVYVINLLLYICLCRASTAVQRKELYNDLLIFVESFQHSLVDECLQCKQGCLLHYFPAHLQFACPDFHQAPETHNSITLSSRMLQLLVQFVLYSDRVGCYTVTHESSKSYMTEVTSELIKSTTHQVVCSVLVDDQN